MSRSGREALKDVREWSRGPLNVRDWLGGPPECQKVVGMPSQMSGSG